MSGEVFWRLMFRVNDRAAADLCLSNVLSRIAADIANEPKPYWKDSSLWEASLITKIPSQATAGEGILMLLAAANSLAYGWLIYGPTLSNEQVSAFEGIFDLRRGRAQVAGLNWASFAIVEPSLAGGK
jgi:hypothetical protein